MVSGRSLNDIDLIFAPDVFRAVAGHGAEMRLSVASEADDVHAPPMDKELKRRLAAIAKLSPGILLEDKGYSLALHYRLAPHAEKAIYEAVSLIRADLPNAPIEVLPGKFVCEIKHSGFTKATGVRELMKHEPFKGAARSSSATTSPMKPCSRSCPRWTGSRSRWAAAPSASTATSMRRTMCVRSSRTCSTIQGWNKASSSQSHIVTRAVPLRVNSSPVNFTPRLSFQNEIPGFPRKTGSSARA